MTILYRKPNPNSVFAGLQIRENPDDAFDNAILLGMMHTEDWMYMYSEHGRDYFKHAVTCAYRSYPQRSIRAAIKKAIRLLHRRILGFGQIQP